MWSVLTQATVQELSASRSCTEVVGLESTTTTVATVATVAGVEETTAAGSWATDRVEANPLRVLPTPETGSDV